MNDNNDPLSWAEKAKENFVAARLFVRRKKPIPSIACFHVQQCAEKYLKALLIAKRHEFPKTHDLLKLNDLCNQAGILIPIDADRLDSLSFLAVQIRYPGDTPDYEAAKEALEIARSVK